MPITIDSLVTAARQRGASDIHLEVGLPPTIRVAGRLERIGGAIDAEATTAIAHELIPQADWDRFMKRRSADLSRTISGARCRINVLHSLDRIGVAVRLLAAVEPTIEQLNLHPDLSLLAQNPHGLVLVSGPSGSGKSSTLAALIHEINVNQDSHIVTIEEPIEYLFHPRSAFIRQREVGRDTPSFEQGLLDVLREDPDVVMVGEMRHPEVMRLTLNVAETGHLTFATVHSANCAEALQRIVNSFSPEIQAAISSQLADCLIGVVCQRLIHHPRLGFRIPELEVLIANAAVRTLIRQGHFYQLGSAISTGAHEGMWTFERYRQWIDKGDHWYRFEESLAEPARGSKRPRTAGTAVRAAGEAAGKAAQ